MYNTIILTGVPRSGSSLACNILNNFKNTIALLEPMKVFDSDPKNGNIGACKDIVNFVFEGRRKVLYEFKVVTGVVDGKIASNTFEETTLNTLRKAIIKNGEIKISREIKPDFHLLLKHPAFFTAILEDLVNFFPCYATIRNPLSILLSWATLDVPVNQGHIPAGERFDQKLQNKLLDIPNVLDRQIVILNWFFEKFDTYLPQENILKYEDTIEQNGLNFKELSYSGILENAIGELKSQNSNSLYKDVDIDLIYNKLLNNSGIFWKYYTVEDINEVYEDLKDHHEQI